MTDRLVVVRWEDTTNIAGWLTPGEITEFATDQGWICENVGWLVEDNAECVVVSARRAFDAQNHRGLTERIPRRSVISITDIGPRSVGTGEPQ